MAVFLKHTTKRHPLQKYFFYEGHAIATNGVIEIPDNRVHWAQRAYKWGYMLDPDTDRRLSWAEVLSLFSAKSTPTPTEETPVVTPATDPEGQTTGTEVTPESDESAKSEDKTDESSTDNDTGAGNEPSADPVKEPVGDDSLPATGSTTSLAGLLP